MGGLGQVRQGLLVLSHQRLELVGIDPIQFVNLDAAFEKLKGGHGFDAALCRHLLFLVFVHVFVCVSGVVGRRRVG